MTRQELLAAFGNNTEVTVSFTKQDGSARTVRGTLDESKTSSGKEIVQPKNERDVLVWDLDKSSYCTINAPSAKVL